MLAIKAIGEALGPLLALRDREGDYANAESDDVERLVESALELIAGMTGTSPDEERAYLLADFYQAGADRVGDEIGRWLGL